MIKRLKHYLPAALLLLALPGLGQTGWDKYAHLFAPVRHYVAFQTYDPIRIDGRPDEVSWSKAAWSDDFVDIEGDRQPKPHYRSRMKMLWDAEALYILTEMEEPHIWATYNQRDMIVYHENDIEVFIDPNGDGNNYFEFEVNALNNLFDLFLPQPYRSGGTPLIAYDARRFESAVQIDGTLNDGSDTDRKWTVEMKIPFADLQIWDGSHVPQDGTNWRVNLSRVNWETEWTDGAYRKKSDPKTGKALPEYNWVWSAAGIVSMHAPERYGIVQFTEATVGSRPAPFRTPTDQRLRDCCWLVFYAQKDYRAKAKTYANTLAELELPATLERNGQQFKVEIEGTTRQFEAIVSDGAGRRFRINNLGQITELKN